MILTRNNFRISSLDDQFWRYIYQYPINQWVFSGKFGLVDTMPAYIGAQSNLISTQLINLVLAYVEEFLVSVTQLAELWSCYLGIILF